MFRKLWSYRMLQRLFTQGEGAFCWTHFLRCCLLCVVLSVYSVVFCTRVSWVCFEMRTMLDNVHMCGIMLVLRAVSTCLGGIWVQEGLFILGAWCLVCQDKRRVVIFTLFYCLLDLRCGEFDVISLLYIYIYIYIYMYVGTPLS